MRREIPSVIMFWRFPLKIEIKYCKRMWTRKRFEKGVWEGADIPKEEGARFSYRSICGRDSEASATNELPLDSSSFLQTRPTSLAPFHEQTRWHAYTYTHVRTRSRASTCTVYSAATRMHSSIWWCTCLSPLRAWKQGVGRSQWASNLLKNSWNLWICKIKRYIYFF